MAAQKVVISKDLKADLQAFFASMSYDKLFILTDTNTQETVSYTHLTLPTILLV